MIDVHLSLELLEAVADGSLSRETFQRLALEHALATSPRTAAAALAPAAAPSSPALREDYDSVFERVQAKFGTWIAAKGTDERRATLDFAELIRLPSREWPRRVQNSRHRFRSPAVAEQLLHRAKSALAEGRPSEVMDAARAAFWVARRLEASFGPTQALQRELTVRASAYEAMASRAQGDLAAARRLIDSVRAARARGELGGDPLVEAELALFEGLFDRDDERFGDAEAEILLALTAASALGASADEVECRLAFARCLARNEELEEAAEVLNPIGTEELLDGAFETHFAALLELAELLARLDRGRPATKALAAARELAKALGGTAPGRLVLTRGLLAARRGWRPEGHQELARAFGLLAEAAPILAARAAVTMAESALAADQPAAAHAAIEQLTALAGLPEQSAAALAALDRGAEGDEARGWLADLGAYFAAAHESPGLVFHRAYPGAHRLP